MEIKENIITKLQKLYRLPEALGQAINCSCYFWKTSLHGRFIAHMQNIHWKACLVNFFYNFYFLTKRQSFKNYEKFLQLRDSEACISKKVIKVFIFKMTCKVLTATIFFYLYLTTLNDWWKCVSYNIQWRNSILLIDNTAVKFPIKSTLEMLNLS